MAKKSVIKNYFLNLSYQIVVMLASLITPPYLARTIGAEAIGIYSYTVSIATYFMLIASMGINIYGQREIAYFQNDKEKSTKVFIELMIIRTVSTIIMCLIFYFVFCINNLYSKYYLFLVFVIIATLFDITWFFKGLEEFKVAVIRSIAMRIGSVICIFVFIKKPNDLWKYFLIYVLGELLGNGALWINLKKYLASIKLKDINLKKHLKPVLILFIPQVAMQIYTVLDKTMIGKILGDMNEVAYYEQSQKIIKLALTVVTSLSGVMLPRMASIFANGTKEQMQEYLYKAFRFVSILVFPIIFGIIAISNNFVPWYYGDGFEKVAIILMVFAPIVFSIGFNDLIGMQYLVATNKQKEYVRTIIAGAIINIIFNLILIPKFMSVGATISSIIAETVVLILQYMCIRKEINFMQLVKNSKNYIFSSICMFIIIILVSIVLKPNPISTIIQICIGGIVYLILLIILKDKVISEIKQKLLGIINKKRNLKSL